MKGIVGRRFAVPLLAAALLVLPGCFYAPLIGVGSSTSSDDAAAEANVRASIPAIEAYHADHGTYAGMSLATLRVHYDAGLPDVRFVGPLNADTYCVESTVGSATYSKGGPAADGAQAREAKRRRLGLDGSRERALAPSGALAEQALTYDEVAL